MNKYNFDATFSMDAFLKAYNERVGKEHITKNYPYKLQYDTGEEFVSLRWELYSAKLDILKKLPHIKSEYEKRASYVKYSKPLGHLGAVMPSLVRHISVNKRIPKLYNAPQKKVDAYGNTLSYNQFVFDASGSLLMIKDFWGDKLQFVLYVVETDGCKYVMDLNEFDDDACYMCRMRYDGTRLTRYDEYEAVADGGFYYSEIYYNLENKLYCTAMFLQHRFERIPDCLAGDISYIEHYYESRRFEFLPKLKLSVTDKDTPVFVYAYELSLKERDKAERIDETSIYSGESKTIFPKKIVCKSSLPNTRQSFTRFKQLLKQCDSDYEKGISFGAFWQILKDFILAEKYDCADDSVLWEPEGFCNTLPKQLLEVLLNDSESCDLCNRELAKFKEQSDRIGIHVARQFVHEDDCGQYEYMEQLNIDFNVSVYEANGEILGTIWSENNYDEFFSRIENSREFKSIVPDQIIKLKIRFGKV